MECRCVVASGLFGGRAVSTGRELVDVGGGDTFAVGVDRSGCVIGWGSAFYGELGAEQEEDVRARVRELALPVDCARVACGRNHVLAVSRDGTSVFSWGWNQWGQVGDMPEVKVTTPMRVPFNDSTTIEAVAAGGMHSLAVDASGRVWSWGQNRFGQLGRESVDSARCGVPGRIALQEDVSTRQVAAGWAHSALVSADGAVYTLGWGLYHQLGHGTAQSVREPGVVDALLGLDETSQVVQVACGTWHTAARTASGDLYTWGWGPDGQLGHGKATVSQVYPRVVDLSPAPAAARASTPPSSAMDAEGEGRELLDVACGARFTVGLCRNGDVVWCGLNSCSASEVVLSPGGKSAPTDNTSTAWRVARRAGEGRVRKIVAGATHAFALVEPKVVAALAKEASNS